MFLLQTEIWPWLVSLTFPLFVVERQKPTRLEMRVALPNGEHLKSESHHGGPAHSALARDRTLKDKTEWEVLRVCCECVNARVNFRVVLTAAWAQAPPAAAKAGGAHVRRCSQYQTLKDRFCRRITAVYRRTYRFKPSLNPENVRLNKENSVDWHWGQSASKSSKTGERSSSSSELGWNRFIICSHFCDNNSHANHPKWANRFIMKTESQSLKVMQLLQTLAWRSVFLLSQTECGTDFPSVSGTFASLGFFLLSVMMDEVSPDVFLCLQNTQLPFCRWPDSGRWETNQNLYRHCTLYPQHTHTRHHLPNSQPCLTFHYLADVLNYAARVNLRESYF